MPTAVHLPNRNIDTMESIPLRAVKFMLWPCYVIGVLAAVLWAEYAGQQDAVRGGVAIGTILILMFIEQIFPRYADRGIRKDPQLRNDIGFFVGNALVEALLATGLFGAALWLAPRLASFVGISIWPGDWSWPAQAVLAFLLCDLIDYWVHRISHRVPWLWSIHLHHHDTTRLHVFKGARNHPFATIVRIVGVYLPLVILGAPPLAVFSYQVFITSIGALAHANLEMRFPQWVSRWLVTPPVHRIHHASAHSLSSYNYGAFTTLWDRFFGTFSTPVPDQDPKFGVEEGGLPEGFWAQIAWPFVRLFAGRSRDRSGG